MPVYEYQCEDCSFLFELKQSFNDNAMITFPRCRGKTRRIFSPVPILFKGLGFYTTDNRKRKELQHKHATEEHMAKAEQPSDKPLEPNVKKEPLEFRYKD